MQLYLKLLPANGSNADLLTNVIGLTLARGEDAKTREYCEKLLRLRPRARAALEGLISAPIARRAHKTAAQQGAQLVNVATESFKASFILGVAYHKTNRPDK